MIDLPSVIFGRAYLRQLLVIAATLALIGCGKPQLTPLSEDATILAFGDSLTVGVGANSAVSYPAVLEKLSGRRVFNRGVSGETTAQGLRRLPGVLEETAPDLLILLEGGNDILRGEAYSTIRENLEAMIGHAVGKGVQVVLIGVPERKLFSSAAPFYRELAEDYQLVYEEGLVGSLLRNPSYKSDPIHLNEAGYRAMAEQIHGMLGDYGLL